jgi:group I intron endonuclease
MKLIGVYMIYNLLNAKFYIGSSVDVWSRWKQHVQELRRGAHVNKGLQQDWNNCLEGAFIFEVLETCLMEHLLSTEQYWMECQPQCWTKLGYNIKAATGPGGHMSEASKQKMRRAWTPERREAMAIRMRDVKIIQKLSATWTNKRKKVMSSRMKTVWKTPEAKIHISQQRHVSGRYV